MSGVFRKHSMVVVGVMGDEASVSINAMDQEGLTGGLTAWLKLDEAQQLRQLLDEAITALKEREHTNDN